jgi:hypothetical protein
MQKTPTSPTLPPFIEHLATKAGKNFVQFNKDKDAGLAPYKDFIQKVNEEQKAELTKRHQLNLDAFRQKVQKEQAFEQILTAPLIELYRTSAGSDQILKAVKERRASLLSDIKGMLPPAPGSLRTKQIFDLLPQQELDFFGPAFDDDWQYSSSGTNEDSAQANRLEGTFGFSAPVFDGGTVSCAAGVLVNFTPKPTFSYLSVIPYVTYSYAYILASTFYAAHINTNFGVMVNSYDNEGNKQVEQDFKINILSVGSQWAETIEGSSDGAVFVLGNEPPTIAIKANRTYQVSIYVETIADGHGGVLASSAVLENFLTAQAYFVAVEYT